MIRNLQLKILKSILFSINIVAGIILILSTLAGSIPPSQNSWIQAFGLIYPMILIVNLIFLIYWIISKSKLAFFTLIIILIGYNNIFNNFQISLFNSSENEANQVELLSYNVQNFKERDRKTYNPATKHKIINFLIETDADIICLQEYHSTNTNLYEPLKEIRDTLGVETYYYESYFNPKYNQLSGLVIFSKYKAVNKGKLKFQGSRTFGIYTDIIINMDTVRIFNIHLASIKLIPEDIDFVVNPEADNSEELKSHYSNIYNKLIQAYQLREKQLKILIEKIESTEHRIILCGDFNDTPSSWVYNQILNYLGDTFFEKGTGIDRTYAGPLPFLRIDYILTGDEISTCGFTRHNLKQSDHYPISAIVEINE